MQYITLYLLNSKKGNIRTGLYFGNRERLCTLFALHGQLMFDVFIIDVTTGVLRKCMWLLLYFWCFAKLIKEGVL